MANAKHTPGEWYVNRSDRYLMRIGVKGKKKWLAVRFLSTDDDLEEAEANAVLMAAAPKLLAALKQFVAACYSSGGSHTGAVTLDLVSEARIALATAGESDE